MAVSVTLSGGGSIIAWQTPSGISFQRFNADHRPVGDVTSIATGPTAWLSAQALADGGFSIIWDTSASATPTAQSYDAAGAASGSTFSIAAPPSADIAFTSRASGHTADVLALASTPLPDGGYVLASLGFADDNVSLPVVRVQRYDADGNALGTDYEFQGALDQFTNPKIVPMPDGGYVLSFLHVTGHSSNLEVVRFDSHGAVLGQSVPVLFSGAAAFPAVLTHSVAALPNGGFVVCWTTSADNQMHAREYNSAAQATSAERLLGEATTSDAAIIDVFSDGDYVVSWTYPSGVAYATFTTSGSPATPADNDLIATIAPTYTLPDGPHDLTLIRTGAQSVTGNALDNIITSNDFVSTLNGAGGNDTLITGHNANILTGGNGADTFRFLYLPWNNTGHITDFALGIDRLDFTALFAAAGYTGSDPVADGYIGLVSDGAGGTRVLFDADGPGGNPWPSLVTTLDQISPMGLTAAQLFSPGGTTPPPVSGQTLTADNTRGEILTGGTGDDIFYAGRNSAVMTGDGGADRYVFQYLPWNGGHITDFISGSDVLDLRPLFSASGYAGTDPIADGYLGLEADESGGTRVMFDPDGTSTGNPWPFLIVTLDHVQPSGVHTGDWLYV